MKRIITVTIFLIMLAVGIYSKLGDLYAAIDLLNATSPVLHGDYENATNEVVNVGTQYVIDAVYLAVFMAIIGIIIGLLKKL